MLELLAQISDVVRASGKLTETGIVGILLFFLISITGGLFLLVTALYRQLFGSKNKTGIVPDVITVHKDFLNKLSLAVEQIAENSAENTTIARSIERTSSKTDSTVNKLMEFMRQFHIDIEKFVSLWKYHIRVIRAMAEKAGFIDDIRDHLDEMEGILDKKLKRDDASH